MAQYRLARRFFIFSVVGLFAVPGATQTFDWGADCLPGSGEFDRFVGRGVVTNVGRIPIDKVDIEILLLSDADVDIQLVDDRTDTVLIGWPRGLLRGPREACTDFEGIRYCYSGYDGGQTVDTYGHEWIRIYGATNRPLTMAAFGYAAGQAHVSYAWNANVTCKEVGSGAFARYVGEWEVDDVGVVPAGKYGVVVELNGREGRDVDVQLFDGDNPVVQWPHGMVSTARSARVNYAGMEITYSGYNGLDGDPGHERIFVRGRVTRDLTIRAFGYQAGFADVTYNFGMGVGGPCDPAGRGCASENELVCKPLPSGAGSVGQEAAGACHTPAWCLDDDTASLHCAALPHADNPGRWTCPEFECVWQDDGGATVF